MKRILSALVAVALVAAAVPAFAEEEQKPGERAGAAVDRAGEKVKKAGHKAKKKVKKAAKEAKEKVRADDTAEDKAERAK
jgi:Ni/Co efflux regulator RcnB